MTLTVPYNCGDMLFQKQKPPLILPARTASNTNYFNNPTHHSSFTITLIQLDTLEPVWLKIKNTHTTCIGHPMAIQDGILPPNWIIVTDTVYTQTKKVIKNEWHSWFFIKLQNACMSLRYLKTCTSQNVAQILLPQPCYPHTKN